MQTHEMQEALRMLSKQHPTVKTITVEYYGSGDSFEEFHSWEADDGTQVDMEQLSDLLWYALEKSDADFNDEGSRGEIRLHLRPNLKVEVDVDHYVTETVSGDGYEEDFGITGADLEEALRL